MYFFIALFSFKTLALEVGAQRTKSYLPLLKDKNIALVVNQTSRVNGTHLIDYLLSKKVKVSKLFALEHGIRGDYDAGEDVANGVDVRTGIPVVSLYGKNKKPKKKDLQNIDTIIFDIQDIGVRFYTYISSLYYILNACGEFNINCIVLDRPSPLAHIVAGPVLELEQKSFLGMYQIPVVHGLTVGELANMIVSEKWLEHSPKLKVINVSGWKRNSHYKLPIKPSPNLPTMNSIYWYPTLALFEPTVMSIGRGTRSPFEKIGFPDPKFGKYSFKPISIPGMSKYPKHEGKVCYGVNLSNKKAPNFTLKFFETYLKKYGKDNFIKYENFFNKLLGNSTDIKKLLNGVPYLDIERNWNENIIKYKKMRQKYLIYE